MDSGRRVLGCLAGVVALGTVGGLAGRPVGDTFTPSLAILFAVIGAIAGAATGVAHFCLGWPLIRWHLGIAGFTFGIVGGWRCLSPTVQPDDIAVTLWMIGIGLQIWVAQDDLRGRPSVMGRRGERRPGRGKRR